MRAVQRLATGITEVTGMPIDRGIAEALAGFVLHWPRTDLPATARLLYQQGRSMSWIGLELGINPRDVSTWCADLPQRPGGRGRTLTDEQKQRVFALRRSGYTQYEIAAMVGSSQAVVSRLLRDHDRRLAEAVREFAAA